MDTTTERTANAFHAISLVAFKLSMDEIGAAVEKSYNFYHLHERDDLEYRKSTGNN
jgi:hypothetical protein